MHGDVRRRGVDLTYVIGRKLDICGTEVLLQTVELRRTRDRHDPRILREHPGQRELRGRHPLPCGDGFHEVHNRLVRLPVLRREARHRVTEVTRVERCGLVDLPREEAFA